VLRVYLILLLIAGFFWLKCYFKKNASARKTYIKHSLVWGFIGSIVVLALSGRLQGIFALSGIFIAFIVRFLPLLLRYGMQFQRFLPLIKSLFSQQRGSKPTVKKTELSKQAACDILGVAITASKQDIIQAHRLLMFKNHPDKGGSAYLAAQINQAKDELLKYK